MTSTPSRTQAVIDLAQGYNTRLMAFGASEPARGGPATVAVHDARDMVRYALHIQLGQIDICGGFGEILHKLVGVVLHGIRTPGDLVNRSDRRRKAR